MDRRLVGIPIFGTELVLFGRHTRNLKKWDKNCVGCKGQFLILYNSNNGDARCWDCITGKERDDHLYHTFDDNY